MVYPVRRATRTVPVGGEEFVVGESRKRLRAAKDGEVIVNYRPRSEHSLPCTEKPRPQARSRGHSTASRLSPDQARRRISTLLRRDLGLSVDPEVIGGENVERFCRLLCESAGRSIARTRGLRELQAFEQYKDYVKRLAHLVRREGPGDRALSAAAFALSVLPLSDAQSCVFVSRHDAKSWLQQTAAKVEVQRVGHFERTVNADGAAEMAAAIYRAYFLRLAPEGRSAKVWAVELAGAAARLKEHLRTAVALLRHGDDAVASPSGDAEETARRLARHLNGEYAAHHFHSAWQAAGFVSELCRYLGDHGYLPAEKCLDEVLNAVNQLIHESHPEKLGPLELALAKFEHERLGRLCLVHSPAGRLKLHRLLEEARAVLAAASAVREV